MKIKVSEATPLQLDWLVAKCEGALSEFGLTDDERYSTDWSQGGPIIERVSINICTNNAGWEAFLDYTVDDRLPASYGPTPLIAAMRCYAASEMGDEVEVPEELK